ncbi:MAG: OmpA family protein [Prolixibacteraceae bacterium]
MKTRIPILFIFCLFVASISFGQYSHIDTAVVKLAVIPTKKVGGFTMHNDSIWLLLKSYTYFNKKQKIEANEFYSVKRKFKEWNLYVMDTSQFVIRRRAKEYYLPSASPFGVFFKDSLIYYIAKRKSISTPLLTESYSGVNRYSQTNEIASNYLYPSLSENGDLYYAFRGYESEHELDLYCRYQFKSKGEKIAKIDAPINSIQNEVTPVLGNSSIFYFASKRNSKNNYDLFSYNADDRNPLKPMSGQINSKYEEKWLISETDSSGFFIRQEKRKAILFKYYCWRVPEEPMDSMLTNPVLSVKNNQIYNPVLASIKAKIVVDEDKDLTRLFQLNMYELTPDMQDSLILMAKFLRSEMDKHLLIIGHASPDGPEYINMNLSINRANSAVEYLLKEEKIDSSRISILYGGEYLFTDTIKARKFSMYTLNGPVIPPMMSVYVLKDNETSENFLANFDMGPETIDYIRFELKDIVPITPERVYLPVKGMTVTDKKENVANLAKKFNAKVEKIKKANRLNSNQVERNTILYIPL